jgi:hypothetical protein
LFVTARDSFSVQLLLQHFVANVVNTGPSMYFDFLEGNNILLTLAPLFLGKVYFKP